MKNIKPILFSTLMVQALLAGKKTQTRRIIKGQPFDAKSDIICQMDDFKKGHWGAKFKYFGEERYEITNLFKPIAQVGDILWVRETYALVPSTAYGKDISFPYRKDWNIIYKASFDRCFSSPWKPSIFMPKDAARLFLRVTNIRVERLQDISDSDAIAEGFIQHKNGQYKNYFEVNGWQCSTPSMSFRSLWKEINGSLSWHQNPYVFVYEFEVLKDKPEGIY